MKMKKKLKNFFTLSRKANDGFTLVELIVVIAILAILGGVAVPAYSGYIEKANEGADRQLIADIEKALTLGGYSKMYPPGSVVGAVGLSKDANATATQDDLDGDTVKDIEEMMEKSFGANWQETLKLKSDKLGSSNNSKILAAMQAAQNGSGQNYFESVPDSSFFAANGNTEAIVSDVDEIASALQGVLDGHGYAFSKFWGEDFHDSVEAGGLKDKWAGNDQMAANLTVFAAASQIQKIASSEKQADKNQMQGWVDSWTGNVQEVTTSNNGYCADLVMQYGQCVAMYNYVKNNSTDPRAAAAMESRYKALENAMIALKNPSAEGGYVGDFNAAIENFWAGSDMQAERAKWQAPAADGGKSQAQKDAEALLASMTAVNSLEDSYVNKDQTGLLGQKNAFAAAGAADVLDTMITYANMDTLPSGDCVVVLTIAADGTPVIISPLQGDETN